MLVSLPPNESTSKEIISDTVYCHSPTLDGRHFADEFLKRRKALGTALDTSTLSQPGSATALSPAGGWNEVLKKEKKDGSEQWNTAFKVVASKKGRRRN
jgi:PERQ amino acid-rich with GYF domain-containing protein